MENLFNSVMVKKPKRNKFDLTHDVKMTGKMGYLMPTMALECVPGDNIKIGCDTLLRMAPLVAPIMHKVDITNHYFFVPHRIIWENWEKFIVDPQGSTLNPAPYITIDGTETALESKLMDYLGLPPFSSVSAPQATEVSALPFAAYQKIYNEYYRDENLITEVPEQLQDGDNNIIKNDLLTIRKRAYEHDYFTAALPFAQKGASVDIPLGDVQLKDDWITGSSGNTPRFIKDDGTVTLGTVSNQAGGIQVAGTGKQAYDPDGTLQTSPTTINDLRRAFKLQEWLEKNARGGTRYIENIKAHFGVMSSDKRLQRPEYITGIKTPIVISEVLNTAGGDGEIQGNMAGHGVGVVRGYSKSYFAEEHGYIIGVMSVMPLPAYMQGIPRNYLKFDPLEYYWPSFANIGEQEIDINELYGYQPSGLFGYIPRYSEYKYCPNRVAGDFRNTLKFWTLVRDFASTPTLSQEFLEVPDDLAVDRIFAVTDGTDNLWIQILHKIKAIRPMPVFGTPTF